MTLNEREAQCHGLVDDSWVQVGAVEGSQRLCQGGFYPCQVADALTLLFQAPVAFNALLGAAGSAEPSDFA
jgi:hypothetical protein